MLVLVDVEVAVVASGSGQPLHKIGQSDWILAASDGITWLHMLSLSYAAQSGFGSGSHIISIGHPLHITGHV